MKDWWVGFRPKLRVAVDAAILLGVKISVVVLILLFALTGAGDYILTRTKATNALNGLNQLIVQLNQVQQQARQPGAPPPPAVQPPQ